MMMWHVSPVALGPTMRSTLLTVPTKGALFLNVFKGRGMASSSSGTGALPAFMDFSFVPLIATPNP